MQMIFLIFCLISSNVWTILVDQTVDVLIQSPLYKAGLEIKY